MARLSVFVASDEPGFRTKVTQLARSSGVPISIVEDALSGSSGQTVDVALVDIRSPTAVWTEIEGIRSRWPAASIIAVASESASERIIKAMRSGANEFFAWPTGSGEPPDAMREGVHAQSEQPAELQ